VGAPSRRVTVQQDPQQSPSTILIVPPLVRDLGAFDLGIPLEHPSGLVVGPQEYYGRCPWLRQKDHSDTCPAVSGRQNSGVRAHPSTETFRVWSEHSLKNGRADCRDQEGCSFDSRRYSTLQHMDMIGTSDDTVSKKTPHFLYRANSMFQCEEGCVVGDFGVCTVLST
jgi:hypothetical protein